MTDKDITRIKQEVYKIQTAPPSTEQVNQMVAIAEKIGAPVPEWHYTNAPVPRKTVNSIATSVHMVLQTEMMLNACVSAETSSDLAKQACNLAKKSCTWAAIAAIAACFSIVISIVVMLCSK